MKDDDVLHFVDSTGTYHAVQPWRALGAQKCERLLQRHRTLVAMKEEIEYSGPDPTKAQVMMDSLLEMLQILLPTVDLNEIIQLDHKTKTDVIICWRKVQPELPFLTPLSA